MKCCYLIVLALLLAAPVVTGTADAVICDKWLAEAVKVQGRVFVQKSGEPEKRDVSLSEKFCFGDIIQVGESSRATIVLNNETVIHLDENTVIVFTGAEKEEETFLLKLLNGAAHFISRTPRQLKIITPFVNAGVEGTEFFIRVGKSGSEVGVIEGTVKTENEKGALILSSGQSSVAEADKPPVMYIRVKMRDAVQWALYYPPVLNYRQSDFPDEGPPWQTSLRESISYYRKGNIAQALSVIEDMHDDIRDPRFYAFRASLFLTVGQVAKATDDINSALMIQPAFSDALALQSIIALALGEKEKASGLANKSLELNPESSAGLMALSYAQQSDYELEKAMETLLTAVNLEPENGLARARLAELYLSFKELDKALSAAERAVSLNPGLSRSRTILGFAHMMQNRTREARAEFEEAIITDQADPLPRLGTGLAMIREGELQEGRQKIEIAAGLDPGNSMIRSYLGKAYYEEKRDAKASAQFSMAKELDPSDPTPFFYDAIRKQGMNQPVEALHDLQKAISLNDKRAVYRSRQLLDEDLAARSASLARIYNDLDFRQLALIEGWRSLSIDPGNYSAHRFMADSYSALPRHEIARVSELLQSQLLQPLNITPVRPRLAESDLFILSGAGPGEMSFNEFNPLFNRNQISLLASGVSGDNSTWGDEVVVSGIHEKVSVSAGQFHYETDGFRENNDQEQDIYNLFMQIRLSHDTSVQAEFRSAEFERGDLPLRFDPDDFLKNFRQEERTDSIRLGFHHAFSPRSDLIGSFIYGNSNIDSRVEDDLSLPFPPFSSHVVTDLETDEDRRYMAEAQHLFHSEQFHLITGMGHFDSEQENTFNINFSPEVPFINLVNSSYDTNGPVRHTNFYAYSLINYPETVTFTLGASADHLQDRILDLDIDRLNPKLGITWDPFPDTTLRAAVFRVVKRSLITNQTLEPTHVAGFNQFFDDDQGTISWRHGIGIDQKLSSVFYCGLELSDRKMEVSRIMSTTNKTEDFQWREQLERVYLYWTPRDWLTLTSEYQYERFDRDPEYTGTEDFMEIRTHRVPLGASFFHPRGLSARMHATYVDQKGEFGNQLDGFIQERDRFWVIDSSMSYRLPKRRGIITVEVRNLFDEQFRFQDTDPASPVIYPERLILARFTLTL